MFADVESRPTRVLIQQFIGRLYKLSNFPDLLLVHHALVSLRPQLLVPRLSFDLLSQHVFHLAQYHLLHYIGLHLVSTEVRRRRLDLLELFHPVASKCLGNLVCIIVLRRFRFLCLFW